VLARIFNYSRLDMKKPPSPFRFGLITITRTFSKNCFFTSPFSFSLPLVTFLRLFPPILSLHQGLDLAGWNPFRVILPHPYFPFSYSSLPYAVELRETMGVRLFAFKVSFSFYRSPTLKILPFLRIYRGLYR